MAYVITADCAACGACMEECPNEAIKEGDIFAIDQELCAECGACMDACPNGAIVEE